MNLKNLSTSISNKYAALGVGLFSMLAANAAMADGADLTSGLTTEVASGKPQLYTIGGIILGLCAVGVVIAFARRTTK